MCIVIVLFYICSTDSCGSSSSSSREREVYFPISVTTNTITISHNSRLPERKTPSQLATYDNYNQ